jgi:hypothetical protein
MMKLKLLTVKKTAFIMYLSHQICNSCLKNFEAHMCVGYGDFYHFNGTKDQVQTSVTYQYK